MKLLVLLLQNTSLSNGTFWNEKQNLVNLTSDVKFEI